jgi:hypothetical protein
MAVKTRPFRYHIHRLPRVDVPTVKAQELRHTEGLTGFVEGLAASDLEERFARALGKNGRVTSFAFRRPLLAGRNIPGEIELDFDVASGAWYQPVMIDGPFAHRSAVQKARDKMNEAILNNYLKATHQPLIRVSAENTTYNVHDLDTQEGANALVDRMFR